MDGYTAEIHETLGGDPFARVKFSYNRLNKLKGITVSRIACNTETFLTLFKNNSKNDRENIVSLTRPRWDTVEGMKEYPGISSTNFEFVFSEIPHLGIKLWQYYESYSNRRCQSEFEYAQGEDIFLRRWSMQDLSYAKSHHLPTYCEMPTRDYLDLLKSLLTIIPLQNINTLQQ